MDVDDRNAGSAYGRWGDGRGKLPKHDDAKSLIPRELIVAQDTDPDDVADVSAEHEQYGHKEPEHRMPRKRDSGKNLLVEILPEHVAYDAESDQNRVDGIGYPDFS